MKEKLLSLFVTTLAITSVTEADTNLRQRELIPEPGILNYVGEPSGKYVLGMCEGDCDEDSNCKVSSICRFSLLSFSNVEYSANLSHAMCRNRIDLYVSKEMEMNQSQGAQVLPALAPTIVLIALILTALCHNVHLGSNAGTSPPSALESV